MLNCHVCVIGSQIWIYIQLVVLTQVMITSLLINSRNIKTIRFSSSEETTPVLPFFQAQGKLHKVLIFNSNI